MKRDLDKTTEVDAAVREGGSLRYWADDELFDHIAEIINENFVLEVEASRRTDSDNASARRRAALN